MFVNHKGDHEVFENVRFVIICDPSQHLWTSAAPAEIRANPGGVRLITPLCSPGTLRTSVSQLTPRRRLSTSRLTKVYKANRRSDLQQSAPALRQRCRHTDINHITKPKHYRTQKPHALNGCHQHSEVRSSEQTSFCYACVEFRIVIGRQDV